MAVKIRLKFRLPKFRFDLGCDFFGTIRRYTDTQITPAKVCVFVSVLLRIRRAETRIFRYRCTDTHTN